MCGIHGFRWNNTSDSMSKMINKAKHRGPDGKGVWCNSYLTLGHNLLSIVDEPSASAQPLESAESVLVYNGEIYNYKELRQSLNYEFKTNTDTEVLLVGLEQQGKEFLYKIDGMFALAFYNKKLGVLTLARDSNGAKPLYYGFLDGRLAFSSEISSLLELGFPRKVSMEGFKHYYYSGLTAGPITCFDGINRLVPGEILEINVMSNSTRSTNINNKALTPFSGKDNEVPELITANLREAVRRTLMGRREIGIFLSAGMDSSAVFYEMANSLKIKANTFSTRFGISIPGCNYNEDADLAKQLAKSYGSIHREITVTESDWVDCLEKSILALEEPRQGKSYPAYYATNKLLSDSGIVVTLSGDGGDELLAGYKHYFTCPTFKERFDALRLNHRVLDNPALHMTSNDQYDYLMSWMPKGGITGDALNDIMYIESLHTLSEDFLVRNDKLGMAFSMEARFPIMCNVFKNFVRSLPGRLKATPKDKGFKWDTGNKFLFRRSYRGKLPPMIVNKSKTGWRAPTDDWVIGSHKHPAPNNSPLRDYLRSVLSDKTIMDIFNIKAEDIENKYLNNYNHFGPLKPSGKPSAGPGLSAQKELFTILMFAVWYKSFKMSM